VGEDGDNLVREYALDDPLQPLKAFLRKDPLVLTVGTGLESVPSIQIAEQKFLPLKFISERALAVGSKGQSWVDVIALGCSGGFHKLTEHLGQGNFKETHIGSANSRLYSMRHLINAAEDALEEDLASLECGRPECLSCPNNLTRS
jgi:aminoglycoside N3'-acetyltransferase